MISQFFVLSQRGDNIVFRDYRGDVQKGSAEIFFRKVKFWKEDGETEAPPVFNVDGVNYFHVKVVGLLFVATTRANVSPSLVFELLQRIARVTKDYLGILNEDSIRKNFVLMYELLDDVNQEPVISLPSDEEDDDDDETSSHKTTVKLEDSPNKRHKSQNTKKEIDDHSNLLQTDNNNKQTRTYLSSSTLPLLLPDKIQHSKEAAKKKGKAAVKKPAKKVKRKVPVAKKTKTKK